MHRNTTGTGALSIGSASPHQLQLTTPLLNFNDLIETALHTHLSASALINFNICIHPSSATTANECKKEGPMLPQLLLGIYYFIICWNYCYILYERKPQGIPFLTSRFICRNHFYIYLWTRGLLIIYTFDLFIHLQEHLLKFGNLAPMCWYIIYFHHHLLLPLPKYA